MTDVLLSQLAHVEITSNRPQESVDWFVNVLGLELTTTEGQSAYLRGSTCAAGGTTCTTR
jgi:catechol 2,3-dioxygenase